MKIAVAQLQSVKGNIEKNISHHQSFIKAAIDNGADAIFFPELSLTGYEPTLAKETATTPGDERLLVFQSLSDANDIVIGVGLPTIHQADIRISMIIFQPHRQRQVYSKQHLHDDELPYFVAGNEQLYITIHGKKLAFAICYESLLLQHVEAVSHAGIDMYLTSVAKSANGVAKASRHYPSIAKKYSIAVLMANCTGYCDNFQSTGSSAAWTKEGTLAGKLDEDSEALLIFDTETEQAHMQSEATKTRTDFINNLRVLMTALVILHHTLIAYGGPGGWYFTDATNSVPARLVMTVLVATNQSFFMGFFFFLAAYFTQSSYTKKGASRFMTDRLKRLGIPLLFYSLLLGPVMNFLIYRFGHHKGATFTQYIGGYDDWIDFGVLWFVAALLLFTLLYVLWKKVSKSEPHKPVPFPSNRQLFFFALFLGIISYLIRIVFPVGWVLHPLGFQIAHFPQYISLFIFGMVAYRNQWVNSITYATGKRWLVIALVLVVIVLPLLIVFISGQIDKAAGNGTWQSFGAAVWEQLTGISIIVGLSGITKHRWNYTTPLLQKASRAAFATYIFHPLVIISATLLMLSWSVDPVIKLLIALPCTITLSFLLGWFITKLPVAKEIV